MPKVSTLKNGMKLLRVPMSGVESIATVVMVKAGSRYEDEADYGVAHFLEHMVFKGTKKYPTNKILTQKVDGVGAAFNAFTSEEGTAFYLRSAAKDLDLTLDILSQLTTQMLLEPEEIERERGVILEEKHMYEDQPNAYNSQEFSKMFCAGTGLGHDIVGTDESIKNIKQETFRRFISRWYRPEHMLLVVAGKKQAVQASDLEEKAERYFKFGKATGKAYRQEDFWEKDFHYGERLNFIDRKTEQTHFIMGWPGLNRFDERDQVLSVLQTILGGNMSSRLFSEVRERRGLCYYVFAQSDVFCDSGYFGASSGVNPDKLTEAIKVSVDEFVKLANGEKKLEAAELARAKDYICGQMTLSAESVYALALNYGTQMLFENRVRTVAQEIQRVQAVTLEDVRALTSEIIRPGELRLSAIGKISDRQKQEVEKIVGARAR